MIYFKSCLHHISWGISAAGSASHSHCGGRGFESPMLHQNIKSVLRNQGGFLFFKKVYSFSHIYGIIKLKMYQTSQTYHTADMFELFVYGEEDV